MKAVIAVLIVISSIGISSACNYNLPPHIHIQPVVILPSGPSIHSNTNTTFNFTTCPTAQAVEIKFHIHDGGPDIIGNMTKGSGTWTYIIRFFPRHGETTVIFNVSGCNNSNKSISIYIDPAGYIYDLDTGARIANASVWLQRPDGTGGWQNIPTGEPIPIAQPDVNPLVTGKDGIYQWGVLSGYYRVHVEAPGYEPANSSIVSIPPPVTDLHVGLKHIYDPNFPPILPLANFSINVNSGFAPLYIQFEDFSTNTTSVESILKG